MLMTRPLEPSLSSCSSSRITAGYNGGGEGDVRQSVSGACRHARGGAAGAGPCMRALTGVGKHAQVGAGTGHQEAAALGLGDDVGPPLLASQLQAGGAGRLAALHCDQARAERAPVLHQLQEARRGGMAKVRRRSKAWGMGDRVAGAGRLQRAQRQARLQAAGAGAGTAAGCSRMPHHRRGPRAWREGHGLLIPLPAGAAAGPAVCRVAAAGLEPRLRRRQAQAQRQGCHHRMHASFHRCRPQCVWADNAQD